MYKKVCPIVRASVGQHIRHSLDHIELSASVANTEIHQSALSSDIQDIHYDIRERGGSDEHDIDAAEHRIERAIQVLSEIEKQNEDSSTDSLSSMNVNACFMLSGDPEEFRLPSTIRREMGFSAHHAIHHMALVKIIAIQTLRIPEEALPSDFGRAPSTVVFDSTER